MGQLTNFGNGVTIQCVVLTGSGQCGKRNLRGSKRKEIADKLSYKSAELLRAEEAKIQMYPGRPEAPFIYSANVLHQAKHEKNVSEYLDPDPIQALGILKTSTCKDVIHAIGHDPFYVIYMTLHQLQVYKKMMKLGHIAVYIDASGVRVPKLKKPDGTLSKYIFLYHAVINCNGAQFSVSQFLSETHTSTYVRLWLMEWCRLGVPHPKEVVTDYARALLTAVVKEFTGYCTIEKYANACQDTVPDCYVRIDVAHFLKTYSVALSKYSRPVRTFYLASVGQLVLCRKVEDARKIIKALLTVSQCDTEGYCNGTKTPTECENQKRFLELLITGKQNLYLKVNESKENGETIHEYEDADETEAGSNWWTDWALAINKEVEHSMTEEGIRANAHFAPKLASRLLRDSGEDIYLLFKFTIMN